MAHTAEVDLAILDVNLAGKESFPIADLLVDKGIPVIFATGYGAGGLEERFEKFPVLAKPFSQASLLSAIDKASAGRN